VTALRVIPWLFTIALLLGSAVGQETFRIAIGVDPDTLDPQQSTTTTVDNIMDYVVEGLVTIDANGRTQPALATSWTTSDDGLTLDVELRQGVTFHDGTPFTSAEVVWTFERLLDPDVRNPRRGPIAAIESVEATGEHAVRFNLSEPAPYLVGALSMTTNVILPPSIVDVEGNSYENITHLVGTGPYRFVERALGENVVVERFDGYWGEMPYYEQVVFQVVPEATTRQSLVLAGQVDLAILPPTSDIPALEANPRTEVVLGPSNRTIFIAINNDDPALDDPRVRQALNYAVDKEAIIQGILFGAAEPMDAPMADSLFGYEEVGMYPYDPERPANSSPRPASRRASSSSTSWPPPAGTCRTSPPPKRSRTSCARSASTRRSAPWIGRRTSARCSSRRNRTRRNSTCSGGRRRTWIPRSRWSSSRVGSTRRTAWRPRSTRTPRSTR